MKLPRFKPGGLVGALLALGLAVSLLEFDKVEKELDRAGLGKWFKNFSYDFPHFFKGVTEPNEVVILYIDDESHEELKIPRNRPVDRRLFTVLLDKLKENKAKGVVFDIVFDSPSEPEVDQEFAKAIARMGKVVLGADFVPFAYGRKEVRGNQIVPPLGLFIDAAANVGEVEAKVDQDLVVRRHATDKDAIIPPLSVACAQTFGGTTNQTEVSRWIRYYGPPGTLSSLSFHRAILEDSILQKVVKDKIVFVGSRMRAKAAGERNDEYRSPYSLFEKFNVFIPGVEIQATQTLNLLRQEWLEKMPRSFERAYFYFLAVSLGLLLPKLRPLLATIFSLVLIALTVGLGFWAMLYWNLVFSWSIGVAVIFFVLIYSILLSSLSLYVEKRLLKQSLSMYLSSARVKQIEKNPAILRPGAEKQELSIFFSDIANFTSFSEGMDSDDLAHMMNRYFEAAVGGCIFPQDGLVVKFIGDAIFAIWNAPDPQKNHQEKACRSALLFRTKDMGLPPSKPGLEVRTRIGLHCGLANVGNFGSSNRIDYTAIGENINLASRMEGLNKYLGTDILITGEIQKAVAGKFVTRYLGLFRLKGFEKVVEVHELLGLPEEAMHSAPLRARFDTGYRLFLSRKWEEAEQVFQELARGEKPDGPSKFYLRTIEEMRRTPLEADWGGEVELKEK